LDAPDGTFGEYLPGGDGTPVREFGPVFGAAGVAATDAAAREAEADLVDWRVRAVPGLRLLGRAAGLLRGRWRGGPATSTPGPDGAQRLPSGAGSSVDGGQSTWMADVDAALRKDRRRSDADPLFSGKNADKLNELIKDPYNQLTAPPPRARLRGFAQSELTTETAASFLKSVSMTLVDESDDPLDLADLDESPILRGRARRGMQDKRWNLDALGENSDQMPPEVDPLPEDVELAQVVHSIWLGGPLVEDGGGMSEFRRNIRAAANRYGEDFTFVVWTDVSHAEFDAVRHFTVRPTGNERLARVWDMLQWARGKEGEPPIHLVNVDAVFNFDAPMELEAMYKLEEAKQNRQGHTARSDILRLEVLDRFPGVYSDGDNVFGDGLLEELQEIVDSQAAFALAHVNNGYDQNVIVFPAKHPGLALYRDGMLHHYTLTQPELWGEDVLTYKPDSRMRTRGKGWWTRPEARMKGYRDSHVLRTGVPLGLFAKASGFTDDTMPTVAAIEVHYTSTYLQPPSAIVGPGPLSADQIPQAMEWVLTTLQHGVTNRPPGDLYLVGVYDMLKRMPDPDMALVKVLRTLAVDLGLAGKIHTATVARLENDGTEWSVPLSDEASTYLQLLPDEEGVPAEGDWPRDEHVRRARLVIPDDYDPGETRPLQPSVALLSNDLHQLTHDRLTKVREDLVGQLARYGSPSGIIDLRHATVHLATLQYGLEQLGDEALANGTVRHASDEAHSAALAIYRDYPGLRVVAREGSQQTNALSYADAEEIVATMSQATATLLGAVDTALAMVGTGLLGPAALESLRRLVQPGEIVLPDDVSVASGTVWGAPELTGLVDAFFAPAAGASSDGATEGQVLPEVVQALLSTHVAGVMGDPMPEGWWDSPDALSQMDAAMGNTGEDSLVQLLTSLKIELGLMNASRVPEDWPEPTVYPFDKFKAAYDRARERLANGGPRYPARRDETGALTSIGDEFGEDDAFGVEIEIQLSGTDAERATTIDEIKAELIDLGVLANPAAGQDPDEHEEYFPDAPLAWKFVEERGLDGEFVSRRLHDTADDWREVETVLAVLRKHGATVSFKAGLHVHISADDFGVAPGPYVALWKLMDASEDLYTRLTMNGDNYMHRGTTQSWPVRAPIDGDVRTSKLREIRFNVKSVRGRISDHMELRSPDSTLALGQIQFNVAFAFAAKRAALRLAHTEGALPFREHLGDHRKLVGRLGADRFARSRQPLCPPACWSVVPTRVGHGVVGRGICGVPLATLCRRT